MNNVQEEKKHFDQSFWAYVKRQFGKNKRAVFSLYCAIFLGVIALSADFLANEKPLVAKYDGKVYFPVLKGYSVNFGFSVWPRHFQNIEWKNLEFDWAIWPPVPYLPQNLDYDNAQFVSPLAKQNVPSMRWHHWLGTDESGRDVLAGMIHATRIAYTVGIVAMSIATFIGLFFGSLAGYFGDDRLQMSRIRLFLNLVFVPLGLFYAFGTRSYILGDAMSASFAAVMGELFISIVILAAFIGTGNLVAFLFKKIPYLGTKINIPVDITVSRMIEIIVSIPTLFLILAIVAVVEKPSVFWVMVIIGFTSWTGIARFIRAELLRIRNLEYIEASIALGYSQTRILLRHAIPNGLPPVFITVAFGIAAAILIESTLSFLGIGTSADTVTWGSLLSMARRAPTAWWLAIFPGLAILFTVTIFNLIGEGLTDALDPRLKK